MRGPWKTICLSFIVALAAGCGGPSDSPPGPLGNHFDDMYIAAIPLDAKKAMFDSQQQWSIAKSENAKADFDYNEATTQLGVAQNELKSTHLSVDSAVSQKKSADNSADQNRINQAVKDLHTAEDQQKAATARVKYLETYRNYLKRYQRYAQENMYFQEAKYEDEKAKIAKANSIAPKGVSYEAFPKQIQERQSRTQSSKEKAEADKVNAVNARTAWLQIQDQADKESGRPTNLWDPMAPKATPATASGTGSAPAANP
ncbi:MAG: hypothetical protein JWO36_6471 [Myxococcales bacterium]|nr:hypothetical protein [Myxococcales bacterium]